MLTSLISPSMMCADLVALSDTLAVFEKTGIDLLHIDIMDGVFVNNFTLGTDYCRSMRRISKIPLDLHLMITEPEKKLSWFDIQPGEWVSVHAESTLHLQKALSEIRALGAHPMVALNPATPLSVLDYVLDDIDGVLIMTVNPGFAGQKMIPAMRSKITDCRAYLDACDKDHIRIEVDGNVSFENAKKMRRAGADVFVGGTSSVFAAGDMKDNITKMREMVV